MLNNWLIIALAVKLVRSDGHNPISAPQARSTVPSQTPYMIKWTPGTPGPVRIELHYADTLYVNITESIINDGSYEWVPSGVFDGKNNFYLAICDLTIQNECTYTFNGRFAISSGTSTSASSSTSVIPSSSSSSATVLTSSLATSGSLILSSTYPTATSIISNAPTPGSASTGGLSLGAKTAIAVVFSVVGTTLIGFALFFWHRKRQVQRRAGYSNSHEKSYGSPMVYKHEGIQGGGRAELEGSHGCSEMGLQQVPNHTKEVIHELPEHVK